jgi:hypothetical protein
MGRRESLHGEDLQRGESGLDTHGRLTGMIPREDIPSAMSQSDTGRAFAKKDPTPVWAPWTASKAAEVRNAIVSCSCVGGDLACSGRLQPAGRDGSRQAARRSYRW